MSRDNKENKKERLKNIINLDRDKIKETTQKNKKEINILEDCKKFCKKYGNKDFKIYSIYSLKNICDEGSGLLNNYFIAEKTKTIDVTTIMQLEYIITNATYTLNLKQIENTRQKTVEFNEKLNKTIHRAEKLEKDAKNRTKEIKHVKNDIKGIITTILAIVLAFSIIPTAISAIEKMDANYVLPFVASIIVFGMFMAIFIYTIYQDKIKWITWFIFGMSIIICILLWVNTVFGFIKINNEKLENNTVNNIENQQ